MKKLTLSLLCLLVLLIPLLALGCEETAPTGTAPLFVTSDALNTAMQQLQSQINNKANQSDLTAQATRIDNIASQGTGNTYTKGELYTRTEVDAIVAAAVKALKDNQAWITGSASGGTGGGSTGGTTGQVTWITNPTNVQILGAAQVCYTVKITNSTGNWVYIRPIININAATGQSPTSVTAIAISIGGSAVNLATANFQFTPVFPTGVVSSVVAIPTTGGNGSGEFQLAANSTVDLLVCVQITAAANIIWNIGTSMNWRSL